MTCVREARQRIQLVNALRAHLAEFGRVAPRAIANIKRLKEILEDPKNGLPQMVTEIGSTYIGQIGTLTDQISRLEKQVRIEVTINPQYRNSAEAMNESVRNEDSVGTAVAFLDKIAASFEYPWPTK